MKKLLFFFILFLGLSAVSLAQQSYFIYIQSDTKDPFAVIMGGKTFHASNGYLIVPQLYNGSHQLYLQVHLQPRLGYQIVIKGKDLGLSLQKVKNVYKLINLQTNEVIEPSLNAVENSSAQKWVENKPDEKAYKQFLSRTIIKTGQNPTSDGVALSFIDYQQLSKDTVNITIPAVPESVGVNENSSKTTSAVSSPAGNQQVVSRSECRNIAQEEDFYAARVSMAKAKSNLKMMEAAEKAFKNRCYTTEQIKNLGSLFLSDLSRLSFFELAHAHVSDVQNFYVLEDQLIDNAFKASFKQMFGK